MSGELIFNLTLRRPTPDGKSYPDTVANLDVSIPAQLAWELFAQAVAQVQFTESVDVIAPRRDKTA